MKIRARFRGAFYAALLVTVVALAGCGTSQSAGASKKEPIQVGVIASMSGAVSQWGTGELAAAQYAVGQVNKTGGIGGRQIELVVRDDRSDNVTAAEVGRELIGNSNIVAVFCCSGSTAAAVVKPLTLAGRVPQLAPDGAPGLTTSNSSYFFRTYPNDVVTSESILAIVKNDLHAAKIAVINSADIFGEGAYDTLNQNGSKFGVSIVDHETYAPDASDMTPQLTKLKSTKPDVLVTWSGDKNLPVLFQNIRQLGFNIPVMGSPTSAVPATINAAGVPNVEGVIYPAQVAPDTGVQAKVVQGWMAAGKGAFTAPNLLGYDTVEVLINALQRLAKDGQTITRASITKYLNMTKMETVGGPLSYTADQHDGYGVNAIVPLVIKDGKSVLFSK